METLSPCRHGTEKPGTPLINRQLADVQLEHSVGMLMTPGPVILPVFFFELGELVIFAMVLFHPHAIRPIFMLVPFVLVVMFGVVVVLVLFRPQGGRDGGQRTEN